MAILDTNGPGRILDIGIVPAVLTNDHNEVFYYWQHSGIKEATLFHVDGHNDMSGCAQLDLKAGNIPQDYYNKLEIGQFIVPAFFCGFVDSIWWLNPHSSEKKLQFMGEKGNEHERKLNVVITQSPVGYYTLEFVSLSGPALLDNKGYYQGIIKKSNELNINEQKPFILDIDLDAFCCDKSVNNTSLDYEGIVGYEKRVDESVKLLGKLKRPDLVTIALSNGNSLGHLGRSYVPQRLSAKVEGYLLWKLRGLYK